MCVFICMHIRGGIRGMRGRTLPSARTRHPADPKGPSTLSNILRYPFLVDPKIFLNSPSVPIYTFSRGKRAQKNAIFWSKFPKKCLKMSFFWPVFFLIFARGAKSLAKTVFLVLWESSESLFGRPKKRSTKFSIVF